VNAKNQNLNEFVIKRKNGGHKFDESHFLVFINIQPLNYTHTQYTILHIYILVKLFQVKQKNDLYTHHISYKDLI